MHTFQIVTTDGRELGPMELGRPDRPIGSVIYGAGPQANLRVVELRESEGDAVLVVEEVWEADARGTQTEPSPLFASGRRLVA